MRSSATCIAVDASWLSQELYRWESQAFSLWMWEHISGRMDDHFLRSGDFCSSAAPPFLQPVVLLHFPSDRCEMQSLEGGSWLL